LSSARIGIVGVAFKPNVRDARNAPAAAVIAGLAERGAEVAFHDPHIDDFVDASGVGRKGRDLEELIAWSDVVVVLTAHAAVDWTRLYETAELVVDTVNSSAGRPARDRQVLRLGAGWSSAPAA
jgi:UDP-N-acetyl-D-mannosaminuronate dehydrogenase